MENQLDNNTWAYIMNYLRPSDLLHLGQTHSHFYQIIQGSARLRKLFEMGAAQHAVELRDVARKLDDSTWAHIMGFLCPQDLLHIGQTHDRFRQIIRASPRLRNGFGISVAEHVASGNVDGLLYAIATRSVNMNDTTLCCTAAQYGQLECLRVLHEHNFPWNALVCAGAAAFGHLACLRYAHEHGCPWNGLVITTAVHYGHHECADYARDNGCHA
jgi:hypothetical protein